jgi:hypothetical protein
MNQIQVLLTKIPHWLFLLIVTFSGGIVSYVSQTPTATLVGAFTTQAGIVALLKGAGAAGLLAVVALLKPGSKVEVAAVRARAAAAKAAVAILMVMMVASQSACVSAVPIAPVNPGNSAQVSGCQSIATEHNGFVLGGITFGAGSTVAGTVAAILPSSQQTAQTGLAIGAAIGAGLTTIAMGGAGLTAASFTNSNCSTFVGNLPMTVRPAVPSDPSFPPPSK